MRIKKANTFQWDANGNMTKQGSNIYLQWDEENRLKSVSKPAQGVCFFYDASGKRFYKNSGQKQMMLVNGSYYMNIPFYDSPVLYTSPYVVVTRDGYTKHYFVEAERFASRIGDGSISGINSHAASSAALAAKQADVDFYAPDSIRPDNFTFLRSMPNHLSARHTTYWQHSDHLGSASWVTDTNGLGYQHLQYMPWGEQFIDKRVANNTYETRYTFSGKERDDETGYSYFGARYYNSDLSIWLSVDPMADKYPSISPYTYCANNPVKLVDPNGREVYIIADYELYNTSANEAFLDLKEAAPNLKLERDPSSGKISIGTDIDESALSKNEIHLREAIESSEFVSMIEIGDNNNYPGSYYGSKKTEVDDENMDIEYQYISTNKVNIGKMQKHENDYHAQRGSGMMHEITEGYEMAKILKDTPDRNSIQSAWQGTNKDGDFIQSPDFYLYKQGHLRATPDVPYAKPKHFFDKP